MPYCTGHAVMEVRPVSRLSALWGSLDRRARVGAAAVAVVAVVGVAAVVVLAGPGSGVKLESGSAATRTIGSEGGSVTATSTAGVTYEFVVPQLILESDVEITITPVTGIEGLPFADGLIGGVEFQPAGLRLGPGTQLIIKPADTVPEPGPTQQIVGFTTDDAGSDLAVQPATPVDGGFAIRIEHFSTGGLALAEVSDLTTLPVNPNGSTQLRRLYELLTASMSTDPLNDLVAVFRAWRAEIEPLINQAQTGTDAKIAIDLFLDWEEILTSYDDPALNEALAPDLAALATATQLAMKRGIDSLNAECISLRSLLFARNVLYLQQYAEVFSPSLTGSGSGLSQPDVLASLCIAPMQSFVRLPDPFTPNESVALDLTYGVKFGSDTELDGAFFDVTLTVSGAFNDGTQTIQTNAGGQLPQTLIATDTTPITIEIRACLAPTQNNANTPLIVLGDVCHVSTLTSRPQGGAAQIEEVLRESEVLSEAGEDTTDGVNDEAFFTDLGNFSSGTLSGTSEHGRGSASADQTSSVTVSGNGSLDVSFSGSAQTSARNDLPLAGDGEGTSSIEVDFTVVDNPVNFTISGQSQLSGSVPGDSFRSATLFVGEFQFVDACSESECTGPRGTLNFNGVLQPGRYRLEGGVYASAGPHRDDGAEMVSNASLSFTFTITGAASAASGADGAAYVSASASSSAPIGSEAALVRRASRTKGSASTWIPAETRYEAA